VKSDGSRRPLRFGKALYLRGARDCLRGGVRRGHCHCGHRRRGHL